jgi:hypothetical protein
MLSESLFLRWERHLSLPFQEAKRTLSPAMEHIAYKAIHFPRSQMYSKSERGHQELCVGKCHIAYFRTGEALEFPLRFTARRCMRFIPTSFPTKRRFWQRSVGCGQIGEAVVCFS